MLRRPVKDRSLTFLSAAVLITAGDPTRLVIPAILSRDAIPASFLLSVRRHLRRHLSIDNRREVNGEMHGRNVIGCDTPAQCLISLVSSGKGGRMVFRKVITNFVHVGHKE